MRIAIDARLNAYRQGGISQYTRQLMTALADVAPDEQIVSFQHRDQLRPLAIAPNVVRRTALTPPHHRFEQWTLPLEVLLARPDVLHCPDFIAPLRRPCPAVVTIHDLAFMHYPDILDTSAKVYYGQVTANAPRADGIIAVSEATRQDIAQFLDIPIEQIDVIYEAAAPLYTRLELREGEARVLNSTPVAAGTFMLFVSTLEPRKNLPTLLQALRICIDRKPDADYRLVVVGRRGWRDEVIFQAVRDLKLGDHVLFAGGVGQYDLRWLYNACRMYINPSLYEGFGLPLLEAMACGAACLAAATSSLPEIGGDAAIYVPPLEAEQWVEQIAALWDDQERRAELGRLGMARARHFSWLRAARETLKVYQRAAERIVTRAVATAQRPEPLPEPPADTVAAPAWLAAPGPGEPRPCLRCGADLLAGELQVELILHTFAADRDGQNLAPRVWTCARCGFTELVAEVLPLVSREHIDESAPVVATNPPVVLEEPDSVIAAAIVEDLPAPEVADADEETPAPIAEDAAQATSADVVTAEPEVEATLPVMPRESADADLFAEVAVGAPQHEERPAINGEIDLPAETLEVLVETEAVATQPIANAAPSVTDAAALNGVAAQPKPKPARARRRAQPADPAAPQPAAPDPATPQPAKRRQSRSKRK